jgi:hypothetical protein
MSNAKHAASRVRWVLLLLALVCWLAGLFWIFDGIWPQWKGNGDIGPMGLQGVIGWTSNNNGMYAAVAAAYFGLFLITQWFFLGPRGGWRVRLNESGRPMRLSILIAALMAALLSAGLLATIAEMGGFWIKFIGDSPGHEDHFHCWPMLITLGVSWLIWSVLFFLYWRPGNRGTQLSRMLRGLFGGSILELLVATPVHVVLLNSKEGEDGCYCERGSYTGLVLGGTVLLWCFGPGLVLLFLREKERREPLLSTGQTPLTT